MTGKRAIPPSDANWGYEHWQKAAELLARVDRDPDFRQKWLVFDIEGGAQVDKLFFDPGKAEAYRASDPELATCSVYGPFRMAADSLSDWEDTSGDPHPYMIIFEKAGQVLMIMRNGSILRATPNEYCMFIE